MPGDQVLWWSKEVHRMVFAASCVGEERASAGVWDLAQDEREDVTRNLF